MTNNERLELYWAYSISHERIAKRLVEKGIASQEDVNETLNRLYENMHDKRVYEFSVSPGCAEIMYIFFNKGLPQNRYISLTDTARKIDKESPSYVIQSWLRSRNTLDFLKIWETQNNSEFDESEYSALLEAMKAPSFTVTPKQWIERTRAIGLTAKQGKNGGTFAHPDIAADFHMWLYPEFRLELIKYFQASKFEENDEDEREEI